MFRKLFLTALALIVLPLLLVNVYLTRYFERRQVALVEQHLADEARVLRVEAAGLDQARLTVWAHDASKRANARVTVIDGGGVVLADSQHDEQTMDNHRLRPEVRAAARGGVGSSVRHSATLDRDFCYVAMPLGDAARPGGVLRVAVSLQDVRADVVAVRWQLVAASLVAGLAALALAALFSRRFSRRVSLLQNFAERLGEQTASLPAQPADELGALAAALSRTGAQLRKLIEGLSLESARREAILASMIEGVLAVDSNRRVVFCNPSFARAVGARCPVSEGLPLTELVRAPRLLEVLDRVFDEREPLKDRLEIRGLAFEVQATPLAHGARRGALLILHDITGLERLERIRKDFVANVSHELRTPLTAIRGYAETLLDGALEDPEHNRKFLETIRAHAIRLNNIASDLLALSDLESGRPAPEPELVPVREVVEAALRTLESEARLRGVSLGTGRSDAVVVAGSRLRLEQALVNLLDNAVKFNRPGGEVLVETLRTADNRAQIVIRDTGIGIPSEDLPRIFERFYRVDKARSREVGGTGLGLSIVKHIVGRMQGTLDVESELGRGSTFTVVLPAA